MAIERLFVGEGVKEVEVKRYLRRELKRAGLAEILIQRTPLVTRIVIYCDRPALVIGRKGSNVKETTRIIEQDFRIEKPEIEVKKVDNPNLEPNIVAYRIASALERGMHSRKVGYKALQAIMRSGAKGAEIVMSGKLVGKGGRSRVLKMKAGYLKKCGKPAIEQVMHGRTIASCKPGVIGVEVSVVPSNVHFPDEINIVSPEDFEIEEAVVEASGEEKAEETPDKGLPNKEEKKEKKKPAEKKPGEKKEVKEEKKPARKTGPKDKEDSKKKTSKKGEPDMKKSESKKVPAKEEGKPAEEKKASGKKEEKKVSKKEETEEKNSAKPAKKAAKKPKAEKKVSKTKKKKEAKKK